MEEVDKVTQTHWKIKRDKEKIASWKDKEKDTKNSMSEHKYHKPER